jgi:hypothetical protein
MSCSLTVDPVRNRTKTVTRRHADTWQTLRAGDRLTLVEKGMGLPKGARQVVLAEVEVVDVRVEPLDRLVEQGQPDEDEVVAEGFPGMTPAEFVDFWLRTHHVTDASTLVRRIEWRYL